MTLWRIRATVDDQPGFLSVLTASLALRGVNILTVQVHTTEAGAVDDFLVDAPAGLTADDLIAAVERGRGRNCWVARSEAQGLADPPTRALGLARRLVHDPDALGEALRGLLSADAVTWRPAPGQDRRGHGGETMRLPDPDGGSFEVVRAAPSFTPAEYARAQALVDLAGAVVRRSVDRVTLVLPDGAELTVRPSTPDDLSGVRVMHERCSERTRYRRYLAGDVRPATGHLRRLLDPPRGVTLLALTGGADGGPEQVVAMANLVAEGAIAEVALLVEDGWQRRGVGGALLRRLVAHAGRAGYVALVAHTHADNVGMLRTLDRLDRPGSVDRDGKMLTLTMPLAGRPVPIQAMPAPRQAVSVPGPAVGVPGPAGPAARPTVPTLALALDRPGSDPAGETPATLEG